VDATPGAHLYGSPVPYGGRVYQGVASEQTLLEWQGAQDFRGGVASLDEKTGAILWRAYTAPPGSAGVSVWSTPALDPALGLLYVGTGNAYAPPAGALSDAMLALRMDDGRVAWSYQATSNDTFNGRGGPGPDRDLGASPNLFDINGRAVVGEGDKGGVYYALDRATGALVWRGAVNFSAPGYAASQVEGFLGTAAVAGGIVYAPTTARAMVHALDATTGRVIWERELDAMPQTYGARMFGPATATGGVVLQGTSSGRVFLLDATSGAMLANLSAGGSVEGGISVSGATFVVPDVGADLWSGGGGVSAYRLNATPIPLTFPSPSASPSPSPSGGDVIHVTSPPSESAAPGQAGVVNGRVPGPAPWLVVLAALGALATRGARRR
jgi:polyvinyl alcohol dehydrogenase (cytochrome)